MNSILRLLRYTPALQVRKETSASIVRKELPTSDTAWQQTSLLVNCFPDVLEFFCSKRRSARIRVTRRE